MSERQGTGAGRDGRPAGGAAAPAEAPARAVPLIPTQAGHTLSGPVPVVPPAGVPQPRTASPAAPAEPPAPADSAAPSYPSHRRQVVALLTAAAVLVSAGGVWAVQQDRAVRADAARAAQAVPNITLL